MLANLSNGGEKCKSVIQNVLGRCNLVMQYKTRLSKLEINWISEKVFVSAYM